MLAPDLPPELKERADRIVSVMQQEANRYSAAAPNMALVAVQFARVTDPASQQPGYEGVWRNARNERCGTLTFNGDGSFYAEYDLFCPHPRDKRWFVETVAAWGRGDELRCEAQLIPSL